MKKVSTIRKPEAVAPEAQVVAAPMLNDYESIMLRHLIRTKEHVIERSKKAVEEADGDVSEYIRYVLDVRKLDPTQFGIAMADFKTINKLPPAAPAEPVTPAPTNG